MVLIPSGWCTIYSKTEVLLGVLDCSLDLEAFHLNPNAPQIPLTAIHTFTKSLGWKGFLKIVWCSLLLKAGPQIRLSLALSSWVFHIYSGGNATTSPGNLFCLFRNLDNCNENATGIAHLLTSFYLDGVLCCRGISQRQAKTMVVFQSRV